MAAIPDSPMSPPTLEGPSRVVRERRMVEMLLIILVVWGIAWLVRVGR